MGITEATIRKWLKQPGERVQEGEVIVEIETAKAVDEVEAPVSGVVQALLVAEGVTVPVREPIAVIDEG
jgi:pyruvate/2-oxoglutarate dehydrogenase complex dihydrolipoamide acyltransferase (E2) component